MHMGEKSETHSVTDILQRKRGRSRVLLRGNVKFRVQNVLLLSYSGTQKRGAPLVL